jgi:hypothetical protein
VGHWRLLVLAALIGARVLVAQSPETVYRPHVAESSPLALEIISAQGPIKAGAPVKIHLVLENRSEHPISLPPSTPGPFVPDIVFDVHDASGARSPETKHGCQIHYFSSCYKPWQGRLIGPTGPAVLTLIAAHKNIERDVFLEPEYDMSHPGTYTIVGY